MKLLEIISQYRRDFTGIYECEGCKHTVELKGYDDRNFHDKVTPKLLCKFCKKSTLDLGIEPQFVETKYPENLRV